MERDISYGEVSVLCDMFNDEIKKREIVFPCEEIQEQACLDFIQQYIDGDDEPHINLCCGATSKS